MTGKKKPDAKSEQLAAAAVGAGADLVQAQTEPQQEVDLAQAAEVHGVDVAGLPLEGVDVADASLILGVEENQPDWLLGQFDVKAKSPNGFWRCGVHFLRTSPTRVFVVENKAAVPHDHDCAIPCCYLTPEEAQRVHQDSWLTVVPGSEMTKD